MITSQDAGSKHINEAIRLIKKLTRNGMHSYETAFNDFLLLSSCSFSNVFDISNRAQREEQYLEITKKYNKEELNSFATILAEIVQAADIYFKEGYIKDILGYIYTTEQFYKKSMAQFFTPAPIARMMSQMIYGENSKLLKEQEFISVSEPTCGSGIMILSLAQNLLNDGINYQNSLLINAWDLDKTCALMAYLQFSIYQIPAIVVHGDSIALKPHSQWITPIYFINGFPGKQRCKCNALKAATVSPLIGQEPMQLSDINIQNTKEKFEIQSLFENTK